ncbi:MAG: preprotein translocase subunit SecY [Candidatus Doudnabacteria bacterium RIFCSPHIGHO2_02_FULL_48_21]|uniref:Protein translocase subunit SecY n=1 Tax=Candidatus Doudnabacteria bacterium RIFCSPLOWO2_02_FULL_48_13 TaxID=1817845 RepID=A0A1F5QC52_9BACT|nr:MAG: preprotein translocase subunit SecY [Candidatus Doudnabacteria bacterium RIFCSPHIGHO2_01_48_18]OGE77526.1 MAG: preprotein translocase subunit SecY [Candidatus Doudnabacteria bacterium RIFCSPHIGHO2_01_FULL_48_180]OGE91667.1 MAG: preprotein translocase subunit SecY [Candidatus Doudnabacteria bacterium RIFCSPHIGHO2_12_FULL_47_25]OGE93361.1 MAG: preprotein translocase subunit SecY [Candidatus Doudnabacteria bacterium RIFCSPHIGHO2_02_FULL_48_21]OGE97445.1 MAG: preprotein translocase subunit 
MIRKFLQIWRVADLRKKILMVLFLLAVTRVLAAIPIPGVNVAALQQFFNQNQLFGLLDIFSGGGLSNFSIAMMGVGPYITASIIIQLMAIIIPSLGELQKEGEQGRVKINQYTRYLTVPLAILQGFGTIALFTRGSGGPQILGFLAPMDWVLILISITAGTLVLMWIGELITEYGIGNGLSLIIFAGIVAQIPTFLSQAALTYNSSQLPTIIGFALIAVFVILAIVTMTEATRNIPVSYAKRVRGNKLYGGVDTHLPIRVNTAGVIPIIFAISVLLFPGVIANFLVNAKTPAIANFAREVNELFQNQTFYGIAYFILVMAFTYFYTSVIFNPQDISENIQKQGGFIPGLRPGRQTAEFLSKVLNRITLAGAIFLGLIAVLPFLMQLVTKTQALTLGGTSLLIVVAVVIETVKQLESQLTMRDYEGF